MDEIKIISSESLGVRGLCTVVETKDRKIIIDPGIALGYHRHGLLPHPAQIAADEIIRGKIIRHMEDSTDIVFSHYHGDHIPMAEAIHINYQLKKLINHFAGQGYGQRVLKMIHIKCSRGHGI